MFTVNSDIKTEEDVGFEPTRLLQQTVFKTVSATQNLSDKSSF